MTRRAISSRSSTLRAAVVPNGNRNCSFTTRTTITNGTRKAGRAMAAAARTTTSARSKPWVRSANQL